MVAARQADIDAKKALGPPARAADADTADPSASPAPPPPAPSAPTAPAPTSDNDDDDDDDDIEASIQRELAALKSGRGSGKMAPGRTAAGGAAGADGQDKGKNKERPRFQSIATDTECCASLALSLSSLPLERAADGRLCARSVLHRDGVALRPGRAHRGARRRGARDWAVPHPVRSLRPRRLRAAEIDARTAAARSFVQRLSPTTITCHSLSLEQVEQQSAGLVEKSFAAWAAANNKTSVTVRPLPRTFPPPLSAPLTPPTPAVRHRTCPALPQPAPLAPPPPPAPRLAHLAPLVRPDHLVARPRPPDPLGPRRPQEPGPRPPPDRTQERVRPERRRGQPVEEQEVQPRADRARRRAQEARAQRGRQGGGGGCERRSGGRGWCGACECGLGRWRSGGGAGRGGDGWSDRRFGGSIVFRQSLSAMYTLSASFLSQRERKLHELEPRPARSPQSRGPSVALARVLQQLRELPSHESPPRSAANRRNRKCKYRSRSSLYSISTPASPTPRAACWPTPTRRTARPRQGCTARRPSCRRAR